MKKTLNILSNDSEYYTIRDFKKNNDFFEHDDFLIIDLALFVGNISDLRNDTIRSFNEFKVKINDEILNKAGDYQSIRIWSSRLDSGSYLSMLYALNYFKEKKYDIKIIFTDDLIYKEKNGNKYKVRSLSGCGNEDIQKLLNLETKLTTNDYNKYVDEWIKAVDENAPLRIMYKGNLKGIDYSFFDKYIFDELKKVKHLTKIELCVNIMINYTTELGNIGDIIIMTRIDELIENNKIKVIGKKAQEYFRVGEPVDTNRFMENKYTIIEMN